MQWHGQEIPTLAEWKAGADAPSPICTAQGCRQRVFLVQKPDGNVKPYDADGVEHPLRCAGVGDLRGRGYERPPDDPRAGRGGVFFQLLNRVPAPEGDRRAVGDLGRRLGFAMQLLGWTDSQLAHRLGVHPGLVGSWLWQNVRPKDVMLGQLQELTGCPRAWLEQGPSQLSVRLIHDLLEELPEEPAELVVDDLLLSLMDRLKEMRPR